MSESQIATSQEGTRFAELVGQAKQTTSRLEVIWNEVGYTPDEKRRQMMDLVDGFRNLCEKKERQEQAVKGQFLSSIAEARKRIRASKEVLGLEHSEDYSTGDMRLTDELAYFEMEADALNKMCTAQREKFETLSEEVVHLSRLLGDEAECDLEEWRDLDSSLTDARLQAFREKKSSLNHAMEERMQTVANVVHSIQALMEELKIPSTTPLDNQIFGSLAMPSSTGLPVLQTTERSASSVGISRAALDEIKAREQELLAQRDARRAKLERMGEEILDLWQQLGVGKDEQDIFTHSVDGMGVQTIEAGEQELNRLRKLKQEKMGDLILEAREKIRKLWDEIGYSEADRSEFKAINVTEDGFTNDLLTQHKMEAEKLSSKLETMRHILEKIEERESLVQQRIDNETSRKDPSRLLTRGGPVHERRQRERRLQEELEVEKKLKSRLPSLTAYLQKNIPIWEKTHKSDFMYRGERYLDVMQRSEEEYAALKDQIKAAKEERKKEELRRLAMASPAPQTSNSVALGRETPRSVRKGQHGSVRLQAAGSGPNNGSRAHPSRGGNVNPNVIGNALVTPERRPAGRNFPHEEANSGTIRDVSNKIASKAQQAAGNGSKTNPNSGVNDDTENTSVTSSL